MQINAYIFLLAALIPMIVGFIWYNPKVFGTTWMKLADMTEEKMKGANMPVIFLVSYLLSIMLSALVWQFVIHQNGIVSLFNGYPEFSGQMEAQSGVLYDQYMELKNQFAGKFRSFGHGALHGTILGILGAIPIIGTNALFERKGFKYVMVNAGYWIVTLALMGGVICEFI